MTTESFLERAKKLIESAYDYETSHIDAGNNYHHLASEGDFDYYNGDNRLAEYCAEMGIDLTGIDIGRLAEDVIYESYMVVGQGFDANKRFRVASYHLGEVESQIDADLLGARLTPYIIDKLNSETNAYWAGAGKDSAWFYIVTDSYWDQVCNLDVIRDLVDSRQKD
jgi:hypothetical protein